MHILASIVFAFIANIDNFTVGIAYGIKKIKIGIYSNLVIALITGIGTFFSMSIGLIISKNIRVLSSSIIGGIILVTIGIYFIWDSRPSKKDISKNNSNEENYKSYFELLESPEKADMDKSGHIDIKESITLALALSLNNIGLGVGASISGLNIFIITIFTFIFSIITIYIGYILGDSYLSKILGKHATMISGIIIIILGLYEIFN